MLDGSGPTYVKFGQFISNRSDIFGKKLANDLAPLRDNVTPFDFELVRPQIPEGITAVDPIPIASASIAQVHRGKLKGRDIVLKVKRPGIESQIKEDLALIRGGISALGLFPNSNIKFMMDWINEFERGILAELDFKSEIRNISFFRDVYRDRADIVIPRPYSRLSSNEVIVMDYVPSVPIKAPFSADRLINTFLDQLLYEGVIHGDLHTGNIGLAGDSLVLYDFGNVIRIEEWYKAAVREFVFGVQSTDPDKVIDAMIKMGMTVRDRPVTKVFMGQYFDYLKTLDLGSFSIDSAEMRNKVSKIPVELDATTLVILRTYTLIEGMCKELEPNFSYEKILQKNIEMLFLDLDYIQEFLNSQFEL